MFTGLVREIGRVREFEKADCLHLSISSREVGTSAREGDSVAVNGVCLSVTKSEKGIMRFDVVRATASQTTLGLLKVGDAVNLEGAIRAGEPFGGHFVTGHIDCVGSISSLVTRPGDVSMTVAFPASYATLVVARGSITIDGVSLTVGEAAHDRATVYLIPHTITNTTLSSRKIHARVNIEFDLMGKYAQRYFGRADDGAISGSFLKEQGFI